LGSITENFASGTRADVDAAQHLHPARGAETVHGRDDRLPDLRPAQHRLRAVVEPVTVDLAEPFVLNALGDLGDLGDVRLEVGAGEEGVAHAGDDGDPRLAVVVEALPRHAKLLEVLHVGRVPRFGPVDRDADDVLVVPLVVDRHPYLPAPSCLPREPDTIVRNAEGSRGDRANTATRSRSRMRNAPLGTHPGLRPLDRLRRW
jgi:hypothetical protein